MKCYPDTAKALKVITILQENGYHAYFVGGCVRDILLDKEPKDYDIATDALPEQIMECFEKTIPTGIDHGTITVMIDKCPFEVTTFRKDVVCDGRHAQVEFTSDLYEDLSRRDFTINAMAYCPGGTISSNQEDRIIDLFNGKQDLAAKVIRTVGDPDDRIKEDYLRMLRAVRFACQIKSGHIDSSLTKIIKKNAKNIIHVSNERIRDELLKILVADPYKGIKHLEYLGLLNYILPEVQATINFSQKSKWHDQDVFTHTLEVVANMRKLTDDPILILAALLHDIGKVASRTINEYGNYNFYGHDHVGAAMAQNVCARLRLSKKETTRIVRLIDNHLALKGVIDSGGHKKTIARFIRKHKDYLEDLLLLSTADCEKVDFAPYVNKVRAMVDEVLEPINEIKSLLDGEDLMFMFDHIEGGPWIREIKDALIEKQILGEITTVKEAADFVWENYNPKNYLPMVEEIENDN